MLDHLDSSRPRYRLLDGRERLDVWKQAFKGPGELTHYEAKGFRTAVAWRMTRAMMIENEELHPDEKLQPPFPPVDAEQFHSLVNQLQVEAGSPTNPLLGYYGLKDILESWPTQEEILYFENLVLGRALEWCLKSSKGKTVKHLRELLGLHAREAQQLVKLAVERGMQTDRDDLDTKRYLTEGQVIDYIERAREAGDMNSEMKGMKLLAQVSGLTKTEPESQMDEMVRGISIVANTISAHRPPDDPLKQIEAGE